MSEPIFLYSAVYATGLVLIGLLLTMREFNRLNRLERPEPGKTEQADRMRKDTTFGYLPGYSGA